MDNLKDVGLVKFVASFFDENTLGKWLAKIMYMLDTNSFRQQAGKLLVWAIIIIVLATAIDKAFYWSRPEQKLILSRHMASIQKRIDTWGKK